MGCSELATNWFVAKLYPLYVCIFFSFLVGGDLILYYTLRTECAKQFFFFLFCLLIILNTACAKQV